MPIASFACLMAPSLAACRGLRLITWNVFTLARAFRTEDVSTVFQHVHIAGLQGTKLRAQKGATHIAQSTPAHNCIHWGYRETTHSNHSVGVTLLLQKRFKAKNIQCIGQLADSTGLTGKAGFAILRQGALHIAPIVAYFLPKPNKSGDRTRKWKHTCSLLRGWVVDTIAKLPQRCTPVLLMDENSDRGLAGKKVEQDQITMGP